MPTDIDVKLAESLAAFRVEVTERFGSLHAELAGLRGEIKSELQWIKRIGASVLLIALGGSAWVIREITTVRDDVRHHDTRIDKVEKRLEGIDAKLDTLIRRTEPKTGG